MDGAAGDQIRQAVDIMDGPVTEALQSGAAPEALELWRVHTEHINRVRMAERAEVARMLPS